ncbi:hypothetical protein [Flammeovirga agarivorans]|uniref:Uncharacterized protein n=1 Tax=Flammeovirga agarivorans TaxID=2726742 RepID=A0A7X8XZ63_9BACT|nr:hypothetical protein [Flammeovirga agarivorans]NLR94864.1 hypothetical protein [Flammeovirga agarivorans]
MNIFDFAVDIKNISVVDTVTDKLLKLSAASKNAYKSMYNALDPKNLEEMMNKSKVKASTAKKGFTFSGLWTDAKKQIKDVEKQVDKLSDKLNKQLGLESTGKTKKYLKSIAKTQAAIWVLQGKNPLLEGARLLGLNAEKAEAAQNAVNGLSRENKGLIGTTRAAYGSLRNLTSGLIDYIAYVGGAYLGTQAFVNYLTEMESQTRKAYLAFGSLENASAAYAKIQSNIASGNFSGNVEDHIGIAQELSRKGINYSDKDSRMISDMSEVFGVSVSEAAQNYTNILSGDLSSLEGLIAGATKHGELLQQQYLDPRKLAEATRGFLHEQKEIHRIALKIPSSLSQILERYKAMGGIFMKALFGDVNSPDSFGEMVKKSLTDVLEYLRKNQGIITGFGQAIGGVFKLTWTFFRELTKVFFLSESKFSALVGGKDGINNLLRNFIIKTGIWVEKVKWFFQEYGSEIKTAISLVGKWLLAVYGFKLAKWFVVSGLQAKQFFNVMSLGSHLMTKKAFPLMKRSLSALGLQSITTANAFRVLRIQMWKLSKMSIRQAAVGSVKSLGTLGRSIMSLGKSLLGVIPLVVSFGAAIWTAIAPILPIVGAVAALIGVVAHFSRTLYNFYKSNKSFALGVNMIAESVKNLWKFFSSWFDQLVLDFKVTYHFISTFIKSIPEMFRNGMQSIKNYLESEDNPLGFLFKDHAFPFIDKLFENLKSVMNWFEGTQFGKFILGTGDWMLEKMTSWGSSIANATDTMLINQQAETYASLMANQALKANSEITLAELSKIRKEAKNQKLSELKGGTSTVQKVVEKTDKQFEGKKGNATLLEATNQTTQEGIDYTKNLFGFGDGSRGVDVNKKALEIKSNASNNEGGTMIGTAIDKVSINIEPGAFSGTGVTSSEVEMVIKKALKEFEKNMKTRVAYGG